MSQQRWSLYGGRWCFSGAVQSGQSVVVPLPDHSCVAVCARATGALARVKVEHTVASPEAMETGSPIWVEWPKGETAGPASCEWLGPVTALRVSATNGTAVFEVQQ